MTNDDPLKDEKGRLIAIRKLYDGDNATKFAQRVGLNVKQWNNFERGYPLSRNAAFQLRSVIKTITIDWIWFGDERGMSVDLLNQLRIAADSGKKRKQGASAKATSKLF